MQLELEEWICVSIESNFPQHNWVPRETFRMDVGQLELGTTC